MRFRDSVIWITGASSGIGKKTAKQFHAEGAHIVFSARREGDLNRVVDKCLGPGDTVVVPPCTLLTSPLRSFKMETRRRLNSLKFATSKRPACFASSAANFAVASA